MIILRLPDSVQSTGVFLKLRAALELILTYPAAAQRQHGVNYKLI